MYIRARIKTTELSLPFAPKHGGDRGSNQYAEWQDNNVVILPDFNFTPMQWQRRRQELECEIKLGDYTDECIERKITPTPTGLVKYTLQEIRHTQSEDVENLMGNPTDAQSVDIQDGEWWRLGSHLLYVGDTSQPAFVDKLPQVAFAFADPPYGANKTGWDKKFYWEHDYLISKAKVVAVTPGIVSIFDFARLTTMPYIWSIASWVTNGMTRGAIGFGNWIYIALFSNRSIYRTDQDVIPVTIDNSNTGDTKHETRKPAGLLVKLITLYSEEGEYIIDPFLGSGTTLFVADELKRNCIGGEINQDYCKEIIARWDKTHDDKAENTIL
jgi:DNA modification methylase